MTSTFSKLSVKCRTTIPREIWRRLDLKPGGTLRYVMRENSVEIERADPVGEDDPFVTFTEWSSEADDKAYAKL